MIPDLSLGFAVIGFGCFVLMPFFAMRVLDYMVVMESVFGLFYLPLDSALTPD